MARLKRLGLVLSEHEKQLVIKLAKLEGKLSLASLIRMLIYRAAFSKGLLVPENDSIEGGANGNLDKGL